MADKAASVLAKLRNKAKASGISYQQCLQLFVQEEFLRKLSKSEYVAADRRTVSVSWQMLVYHAKYCRLLARCCAERCQGNKELAQKYMDALRLEMSKDEDALQRYWDLGLFFVRMREYMM